MRRPEQLVRLMLWVSPGGTFQLISTAALHICCLSCPTRLNLPDPPQHLLLLQFSWRLGSSEEVRAALSSVFLPQRHSASTACCCALARAGPGQTQVVPTMQGEAHGQTHAITTLVLAHLLAYVINFLPVCVDTPEHPDHPSSSAGVFHGELNRA